MTSHNQLQFFAYQHLPPHLQFISKPFGELAQKFDAELPDNPEKVKMLDALMVAKDCAVRASLWVDAEKLVKVLNLIKANGRLKITGLGTGNPCLFTVHGSRLIVDSLLEQGPFLHAIIPYAQIKSPNVIVEYSYDASTDRVEIDWVEPDGDDNAVFVPVADFIYGRLPK